MDKNGAVRFGDVARARCYTDDTRSHVCGLDLEDLCV